MKRLFMVLFIVILYFGIAGCPASDDSSYNTVKTSIVTKQDAGSDKSSGDTIGNDTIGGDIQGGDTVGGGQYPAVPEPTTLFLLGSGLVVLAGLGRKKFRK